MTKLSPQTQSIIDAYSEANDCYVEEYGQLAAALRVLLDKAENFYDPSEGKTAAVREDDILAIIKELEQYQ